MYFLEIYMIFGLLCNLARAQEIYQTDLNFRIDPGSRTCFFERGRVGDVMELFYQVIDGQHGDLDISVDVIDPTGAKIISEYKKSQNSVIMELEHEGDYMFCMDNSYSVMNSKLVYMYVVIEDRQAKEKVPEGAANVVDDNVQGGEEIEIIEWTGTTENGEPYNIDVTLIIDSLIRTLNHVIKARHMLDVYSASKSRDSYMALEDTFVVDAWSAFQIIFMSIVGFTQVYMIKKLFTKETHQVNA